MNIQFISYDGKESYVSKNNIKASCFNNAKSFDEFEINIISLQNELIWRNKADSYTAVDCINDLISLNTQIINSNTSTIIILLPQNYCYKYYKKLRDPGYYNENELKDIINIWAGTLLQNTLFHRILSCNSIIYDNSTTIINQINIGSTFSFNSGKGLTFSQGKHITTVKESDRLYLTGLNFKTSGFFLDDFLSEIGLVRNSTEKPIWIDKISFYNDLELNDKLKEETERKRKIEQIIKNTKNALNNNLKYKSILYTNGQELVDVVFDILQEILNYNLEEFEDVKKEDFLIKKDSVTFVGEIKGVNSNVNRGNVGQITQHCDDYIDSLCDDINNETVKGILIICPLRKKPLYEREPIHIDVIETASKRDILIITTDVLLKVFEKFLQKQLTCEDIIELFTNKVGLLSETDFQGD